MEERKARTPAYTGLRQCAGVGYSLLHPLGWQRRQWTDGRGGVVLLPSGDDDVTAVMVEVRDLSDSITVDDVGLLRDELASLIRDLPNAHIEGLESFAAGTLACIEATYTFTEAAATRQRWVRILAQGRRQVIVTAQGASPEAYAYWKPQFYTILMTVRVHAGDNPLDPNELIRGRS